MKLMANILSIQPECGELIINMDLKSESVRGDLGIAVEVEKYTDLKELEDMVNKKDVQYEIEIKPYRKKRSNDANAYMWVLCDKIADIMGNGMTKEEVYREAVRKVGVFEILPIKKEAISRFIKNWCRNGMGWVCDNTGRSKLDGFENIVAYYGSSTYNTKEMSRLIDYIVEEAKDYGIETLPPDKLKSLKESWRNVDETRKNKGNRNTKKS